MKDSIRIQVKLLVSLIIIIFSIHVSLNTDQTHKYISLLIDIPQYEWWRYCVASILYSGVIISSLFRNEHNFKGFVRIAWEFYVLGQWSGGLTKKEINVLNAKKTLIEKTQEGMYELPLIDAILDHNGLLNVKTKITGKNHNKLKFKYQRTFNDSSKNQFVSNYKRKSKKFA